MFLEQHHRIWWCWEESLQYSYARARIDNPMLFPMGFSFFAFGSIFIQAPERLAINKYVWPCQREKDYCISNQLKCVGWAVEHQLSRPPAFYKSETPQRAVAPRLFKMSARRNFRWNDVLARLATSEILLFDDVKFKYYSWTLRNIRMGPKI